MPQQVALDPVHEKRLLRYIHTGKEAPKYFPGCWSSHRYFEANKLAVLNEIFAKNTNISDVLQILLEAERDKLYTRFETIAFALAKCLLLGSAAEKEAIYNAAAEICTTPEQMMLFNKYTRFLKTGNGQGWCKTIREWYKKKEPMELAKELTRVRARYGRSHKTLLKKSHVKVTDDDCGRNAVVKYTIFGLKRAKQIIGDRPGTHEIFEYIQKVEDLRHCEDPVAAGQMITQHNFTLDHVPGHLVTSQEVWDAVLPNLSLSDILCNIQRIHNMGFLSNNSTTASILVSLLNNSDIIRTSKVTPIEVYITFCNYRAKTKPAKFEKAKVAAEKEQRRRARQIYDTSTGLWKWTTDKRHPKEVKNWGIDHPVNVSVLTALNRLVDKTWVLTPPTNARYMITLDMRNNMFKGRHFCKSNIMAKKSRKKSDSKPAPPPLSGDGDTEKKSNKHLLAECFYNKYVTPGHAAIVLALHLLKRENHVKIAVFTEEGVELVSIDRNFSSIDDAEFILRQANLGRVQLDAPIQWAMKTKQRFDVFINMIDRSTRFMELDKEDRGGRGPGGRYGPPPETPDVPDHCPVRALYRYRDQVGIKEAKLIVMNLASHRVETTDGSHEGVLDVVGIDEHVPKLIDAFTLGQFK